jgi:hypothetical protein
MSSTRAIAKCPQRHPVQDFEIRYENMFERILIRSHKHTSPKDCEFEFGQGELKERKENMFRSG